MTGRLGAEHYGEERLETEMKKAERIVGEEMRQLGWKEEDLVGRAKGDFGKVRMAARLRQETMVTVKWIANRLGMGSAGYVNNRLYRWRKGILR